MSTWGEILTGLKQTAEKGVIPPFDAVRRKYLASVYKNTGRNTILYATNWTQAGDIDPELLSITDEDVQGMMEVIHGLKGPNLDLIVHSPGGSAEATEAIVSYLRTKFSDIRVIIPQSAMSAATMLACASNRIVMGKHSFIGPIDPQMILHTQVGVKAVPAQAILDQFELAKYECEDPKKLGSWIPILSQYGPALLVQCANALELSQQLVSEWLELYMFVDREDAEDISKEIAAKLADHKEFKSHARHINRDKAKKMGLVIEDLEDDQKFQDLVLSVFHTTTHTFNGTNAVKIIENHNGKAFVKQQQRILIQQPTQPPEPGIEPQE
jgi:predicted amino acid-binding ACT domain protein